MGDTALLGWGTTYTGCNLAGAAVEVRIENFTGPPSAAASNASRPGKPGIVILTAVL